ncbi:uncharacterized protein LOC115887488 isoform X2 [Sitophilus oryzae]|uniref:Uncharacterized protein LOC115887488 isoform X2 n=1 Tax=Sitophilus oryzae TaxID=7048 RepID=A0A6J2YFS0_SITOR|nr:uncharacterized protein LOC115887488 isoform X2 [Sitophilus oryzae]
MSQTVYEMLAFELTPVPRAISDLIGIKINSGVWNGALWIFLIWSVFHLAFDVSFNKILRRNDYKPHICSRLTNSLWLLVTYIFFFSYFLKLVLKYHLDVFNWKSKFLQPFSNAPADISVGILVLSMFYLHMLLYQITRLDKSESVLRYFLMFTIYTIYYSSGKIEMPLVLAVFISGAEILTELIRVVFCLLTEIDTWPNKCIKGVFLFDHLVWIVMYIIIIPLRLMLTPMKRLWMMSKRKPKSRNVLFQTIKCMLAIKRKKNEKKDNADELNSDETNEDETDEESIEQDIENSYNEEDNFQEGKLVIKLQKSESTIEDIPPSECPDTQISIQNDISELDSEEKLL